MSKKRRFSMTMREENKPVAAELTESMDMSAEMGEVTKVSEYKFGDGLNYDPITHTVTAEKTDSVELGNDLPVTSSAVAARFDQLEYENGNSANYSSEEQIVGTWIDGRALYQKTVEFTDVTISNTRENSAKHLIDGVDQAFVAEAYLRDTSIKGLNGNYANVIGGLYINNNSAVIQWVADSRYVWINANTFFNASENRTWRIVLRYTKLGE